MKHCAICQKGLLHLIYHGRIRDGKYGQWTSKEKNVYQCEVCKTLWHSNDYAGEALYEGALYRELLEDDASIQTYHQKHDFETMRKVEWVGTPILREKIVADIGCGGGSFLDCVSGSANEIIAIEPTSAFHPWLRNQGYAVFPYTVDALEQYRDKVDIATSFDVIEHVEDPLSFVNEIHQLLRPGGVAIIGTPTDYPHLRRLIGQDFEEFLFSTQHLWIFSEEGLKILMERVGFKEIRIEYKQMYGLGNTISWALHRCPRGYSSYDFITDTMDAVYREEMIRTKQSDYLVAYAKG